MEERAQRLKCCIPARGVYDYPHHDIFYVCDLVAAGLGEVHWGE